VLPFRQFRVRGLAERGKGRGGVGEGGRNGRMKQRVRITAKGIDLLVMAAPRTRP